MNATSPKHVRVAVLGAGLSGICMGVQLKRRGIENFVILEKAEAVGGTWRENTYPGIACDVPSHVYSYSFELNPNWSHSYGSGREIWEYCRHCVDKYQLTPHLRCNHEVASVRFDGTLWQIATTTGERYQADVAVSGLGGLHLPKSADLPQAESFAGSRFHTARWDHDHDLTGRRVAIIGTGASAAQVLPGIADEVAHVTVFQRSAAWVLPRMAREISARRRDLFRRWPLAMRCYRWFLWLLLDAVGVLSLRRNGPLSPRLRRICERHLARSVQDPELRARLTPDYDPGCKRRCVSDDYLATFNRPNVALCTDPIAAVEPRGVRDVTGSLHEVDTIIEATGFKPFDIAEYADISGRDGHRLADAWAEHVSAYRSVMTPGFPNFFFLLGPNSGTGHTSALIMIESQAQFVMKALAFMETHRLDHLDPDPAITAQYNDRLQRAMRKMVFSGGCNAWYTDAEDHNFTLWPYSASRFVAELWRFRPRDFAH